ncbi:MAG TPA: hypothetical protein VHW69_00585 [Rhizomicrobium sp.]|jgi:hypothetical protein|nr:hypothetical protein [Rhizomicrobium sp.]
MPSLQQFSDCRDRAMRPSLIIALIVAVALGALWLSAGSSLTMLADRVFAVGMATPPVGEFAYDGGGFRAAEFSLTFGSTDNQRFDFELRSNASGLVVLASNGRSFTLGPRTNPVDASGRPDIDFIPEHGDKVVLTTSHSLLGWPTPFEIDFMTRTPSWKRCVYYRLSWKKRSGAELAMHWRYEQDYFTGNGWTVPAMMWNFHTGLTRVDITKPSRATPR